jgi:uncharacterized protein (DUF3084 family)
MEDADEALERNVNESKEELKQWKDERIKSLRTPDLYPDIDEKNVKQQEGCNKSLEDLGTPTKKGNSSLNNAIKEQENLTSKLLYVTKENTKLLQEIGKLKQQQMLLEESLKDITTDNKRDVDTSLADAEYKNLLADAERQRTEIASLKSDIQRLKSKKGHVSKDTMLCKALS